MTEKVFTVGDVWETRDGRKATIKAVIDETDYPVIALIEGDNTAQLYKKTGLWGVALESEFDLIRKIEPEREVWMAIYEDGYAVGYKTKKDTVSSCTRRIALKRVVYRLGDEE